MIDLQDDIQEVFLSEEQLRRRSAEMGAQISADYAGKNPLLVFVLRGSLVFMADMLRSVTIPCQIDSVGVTSYGSGTVSSGTAKLTKDLTENITGRHVILVEDILDTGTTLHSLCDLLQSRDPASLSIAVLLDKPSRRKADIHADYIGFEVPDAFLVGYGLDYAEYYRNLPYIGLLKPRVYE